MRRRRQTLVCSMLLLAPLIILLYGQALNTLDRIHDLNFQQRTAPTLENLAQAGQFFKPPIRLEDDFTNTSVVLDYCSASTLVANEVETSQRYPESTSREKSLMPLLLRKIDEDTIQRVMEIAFLRLLIQFVVGITNFLHPEATPSHTTAGDEKIMQRTEPWLEEEETLLNTT